MPTSALFVDRPSLLFHEAVEKGQPTVQTNLAALTGLTQMNARGFRLFFVGNDDFAARQCVPEKRHERVSARIVETLTRAGIHVTADYTCVWSPEGAATNRRDSVFRLPNVGALKAARLEFDVPLETSWILSDRAEAMLAGSRSGVRTALIRSPKNDRRFDVTPDLVADDLGTAIRFLNRLQIAWTR